jgi:hypothetical protein
MNKPERTALATAFTAYATIGQSVAETNRILGDASMRSI